MSWLDRMPVRGEMADRVRGYDWTSTPLGEPEGWPAVLRVMLPTCLASKFPMMLLWGPELIQIYNDAHIPIMASKHPRLGVSWLETWPEVVDSAGAMLLGVLAGDDAIWAEDLPLVLERDGTLGESFFTFSYSPVLDGTRPGGVLSTAFETTSQVVGRRRLELLDEVRRAATTTDGMAGAVAAVADALGSHVADVPLAALYVRREDDAGYHTAACGIPAAPGPEAWTRRRSGPVDLRSTPLAGVLPRSAHDAIVQGGWISELGDEGFVVCGLSPHTPLDAAHEQLMTRLASTLRRGFSLVRASAHERTRHATELARTERMYRLVAERSSDLLLIGSPTGKIRWASQSFANLGYAPAELVGVDAFSLVHPDDRQSAIELVSDQLAAGGQATWTGRLGARDGSWSWYESTAQGFLDPSTGEPTELQCAMRDVTERRAREVEALALREVAELVANNATTTEVCGAVAGRLLKLLGGYASAVVRFEPGTRTGRVIAGVGPGGAEYGGAEMSLDSETAAAEVFATGRSARVDGPPDAADPTSRQIAELRLTGGLAAPLVVDGRLWGSVGVAFRGTPIPAGAEERLELFGRLTAMAVANAQAWETLSSQATTDSLTGLPNHRSFHARLREEVERARRYGRELSLVLLDIDHFKAINDTHGHQAGDRVLTEIAQALAAHCRDAELVARVGGEEFGWLIPESDAETAMRAAERMRRTIESHRFADVGAITVSAGVSASEGAPDPERLLRRADRALYWAKEHGRNTTFLYTPHADARWPQTPAPREPRGVMTSVRALARAIDSKDSGTRRHSERVAELAERLALALGWTTKRARLLHECGLLHDVGKIGIPDEILLKPSRLSPEEYEQVKGHAALGAQIVSEVFEDEQVAWVRSHHERWDGSGYPDGLSAEQIPDGAQILALADAYDVMTETRIYKEPKSIDDALADCAEQSGRQFAPDAVTALSGLVEPVRDTTTPTAVQA